MAKFLPPLPLVFPALVSGVLVTLCLPVVSWWWLSFVALVPILIAVQKYRPERRESFRAGFLLGAACYFSMLWWIVKLIPSADVTIPWLMTPALILLVVYLALYPAFLLLILGPVTRWRFVPILLSAPSLWALFELARSRGELAFPWGSLGYTLTYVPSLTQLASVGGLVGLSFLIVAVNVLVSGVFVVRHAAGRTLCLLAAAGVVAGMWSYGETTIANFERAAAPKIEVAVVQPNVDLALKWKPEFKDSTFHLIDRLTQEAADGGADITFFPETSAPVYIDNPRNALYRQHLISLAERTGRPFFIGFLDYRYDGPAGAVNIYNSSGLFTPDGRIVKYDKTHLLPFGEALPLAWKYRWLQKIDFGQANFEPGTRTEPIDAGAIEFTPLICFESVFPYLCRRGVLEGSELFVNITNDGWFSDTPGPYQHAEMAVMRSVEFRRYLVRSANTGISFVVDPVGRVVARLGLFEEGILYAKVAPRTDLTVYARYGDWPLGAASVLLVLVALLVRGPRRHSPRETFRYVDSRRTRSTEA